MAEILNLPIPSELADLYSENIQYIFDAECHVPVWNDWIGFGKTDLEFWNSLPNAVPIFGDGCGSLFGLDLLSEGPRHAVYFFDHSDSFEFPRWAAGSSLATFLLILGDMDRALEEDWPEGWELKIDPDLAHCRRPDLI